MANRKNIKGTRAASRIIRKVWMGDDPKHCDICRKPFTDKTFIDGVMKQGPWAMMCSECHAVIGVGIGTGMGQKYKLEKTSKEWVKVEG